VFLNLTKSLNFKLKFQNGKKIDLEWFPNSDYEMCGM